MKVLFAVNNEDISEAIIKMYQKEYKEIITYKNVYYFNAILKELQKDKSYDRVIISEDLEPFTNNNYDTIDKFIFEKLDKISDEATNSGEDIPIIMICTDRRTKSEPMLMKLFGIGIYNAILGDDRTVQEVCNLLKSPRNKKDAKIYYKIDTDEVEYQSENEDTVSEVELQNILAHYKKLGKDESRYVESFNNIAAQYNDNQLRLIAKILPLNVKAVLEAHSPKYQSVMTFRDSQYNKYKTEKKSTGLNIGFIKNNKPQMSKPVIIPSSMDTQNVRKINKTVEPIKENKIEPEKIIKPQTENIPTKLNLFEEDDEETKNEKIIEPVKRGRGRPKKQIVPSEIQVQAPKRGRGRPKKAVESMQIEEQTNLENETIDLFNLSDDDKEENINSIKVKDREKPRKTTSLFDLSNDDYDDEKDVSDVLPGFEEEDNYSKLQSNNVKTKYEPPTFNESKYVPKTAASYKNEEEIKTPIYNKFNSYESSLDNLLIGDKKIISFIGTSKNGTSFLVNNLGELFSTMGIKTAILDTTQNKNSFYIYTKNEEELRTIASYSFENLRSGKAQGIEVNRNLSVYTSLPGEGTQQIEDYENILTTLIQNYSVILIDCDFKTPIGYFEKSQETYLVQSMDVLTIQPLTEFLRDLKSQGVLKPEKLRIVINKEQNVKTLTAETIVGGLAYYNAPSMSFMTELFNKDTIKYYTIPFDIQVYSKYLEGLANCKITLNKYPKEFIVNLKKLAEVVYPLINNKSSLNNYGSKNTFSANTNNTLNMMKNRY